MGSGIRSVYVYSSVGCAVVAAIIALVAVVEAHRQNQFALNTQKAVVAFETNDAFLDMVGQIKHTAFNQEAYENIVLSWKPDWIGSQFTSYLTNTGIHNVAVFGPDGNLRRLDSDAGLNARQLAQAKGMKALLAAVDTSRGKGEVAPFQGVLTIGDRIFFAVAAPVTPKNTLDAPVAKELHNTLVFFKPAEDEFFDLLSVGFQARDVHIVRSAAVPKDFAAFPLHDAAGAPAAYVRWRPHLPGVGFLSVLFPALAALFLVLAVFLGFAVERWRAAQKKILASETKAAAAEEENRIKTVFLGNVSHELRTPMNAIIGFAEMLRMQPFGPLGSARYGEYVDDILFSSRELLSIVNDLLEIANLKTESFKLETEPCDAAITLLEAVQAARPQAASRKVGLIFSGDGKGAWCLCAPLRLRQALSRLIEATIKVSGEGESVTVWWRHENGDILIGLRDQADAPTDQAIENVDKLFLAGDNHFVANKNGLKLGVTIAAGLIRAMGGRMGIAPGETGSGTVLTIRLPIAEAPARADAA